MVEVVLVVDPGKLNWQLRACFSDKPSSPAPTYPLASHLPFVGIAISKTEIVLQYEGNKIFLRDDRFTGFLLSRDSTIGDLVTNSVTFEKHYHRAHLKTCPLLRHVIKVMRRHALTNNKTNTLRKHSKEI